MVASRAATLGGWKGPWCYPRFLRGGLLAQIEPATRDWARDYRVAPEDDMNAFGHWFLWPAHQRSPLDSSTG